MTGNFPVIKNYAYCLAHVPDLVRYGSKPRREIAKDPLVEKKIQDHLRDYVAALRYPPNQVFIGDLTPEQLRKIPRPWFDEKNWLKQFKFGKGLFGEIADQKLFYALLKIADVLNPPLFEATEKTCEKFIRRIKSHCVLGGMNTDNIRPTPLEEICRKIEQADAEYQRIVELINAHADSTDVKKFLNKIDNPRNSILPIYAKDGALIGCFNRDNRDFGGEDENLTAPKLLETLTAKASGALALMWLLRRENIGPESIDYIINCDESACGDRYQAGGGGLAQAIGEMCGCVNASGFDIKDFCLAPIDSIIVAAHDVANGTYKNVVVVGGGCLAKLGMRFEGFVRNNNPILDDCLGTVAFLISENDGQSPIIRLEPGAIGNHPIGAGPIDAVVYENVIIKPLDTLGLTISDIDKFATEFQDVEIMEKYASVGDVAYKNSRKIAIRAAKVLKISDNEKEEFIENFILEKCLPGFAPPQGHIPSAVPYIGHAIEAMKQRKIKRAMFIGKGSSHLNRVAKSFTTRSFILEDNPKR